MNKVLLFLISFSTTISIGQVSYDFSEPLPVDEIKCTTVSFSNFGLYESENHETYYEFNPEGIWIVTTIYSSIAKETIRESSKYVVRNGYIFGVIKNDSLPCVLENDRYYFGLKNRDQVIGGASLNVLKKMGRNSYVLNFYEKGAFTPSLLVFLDKTLTIQHFDYETGTTQFSQIKQQTNKQTEGMNYITLTPSIKEWNELDKKMLFGPKISYLFKSN